MAWKLSGTYFENCPCDSVCPCTTSELTGPADVDRCTVLLTFHIDSGDIDGADVSGLNVAGFFDAPSPMSDGGWKAGLLIDAAASDEQAERLRAVFSGEKGGPTGALAPLIGEVLGMERLPFDYTNDGARHRVVIGDAVDIEVEDYVSPNTHQTLKITGLGFPNEWVSVARAKTSRIQAFGYDVSHAGKNAHASSFAWSGG
jgi:hypothetical protein